MAGFFSFLFALSTGAFWGDPVSRVYRYLPEIAQNDLLVAEPMWERLVDVTAGPNGRVLDPGADVAELTRAGGVVYRVSFWGHSILSDGVFAPTRVAHNMSVTIWPALTGPPGVAEKMNIAREAAFRDARDNLPRVARYLTPALASKPIPFTCEVVDRWTTTWPKGYVINAISAACLIGAGVSTWWALARPKHSGRSDASATMRPPA